mmetsp:Transcript_40531/g.120932  ORF Transcript_40531/g.120932 Transcript_40531/m.120932 type:complete len:327 (+) Transcript_40531:1085-2065(+)
MIAVVEAMNLGPGRRHGCGWSAPCTPLTSCLGGGSRGLRRTSVTMSGRRKLLRLRQRRLQQWARGAAARRCRPAWRACCTWIVFMTTTRGTRCRHLALPTRHRPFGSRPRRRSRHSSSNSSGKGRFRRTRRGGGLTRLASRSWQASRLGHQAMSNSSRRISGSRSSRRSSSRNSRSSSSCCSARSATWTPTPMQRCCQSWRSPRMYRCTLAARPSSRARRSRCWAASRRGSALTWGQTVRCLMVPVRRCPLRRWRRQRPGLAPQSGCSCHRRPPKRRQAPRHSSQRTASTRRGRRRQRVTKNSRRWQQQRSARRRECARSRACCRP